MTVKELKNILENYSDDVEVMHYGFDEICKVKEDTWIHTNYPYDKPDRQVVILE